MSVNRVVLKWTDVGPDVYSNLLKVTSFPVMKKVCISDGMELVYGLDNLHILKGPNNEFLKVLKQHMLLSRCLLQGRPCTFQ